MSIWHKVTSALAQRNKATREAHVANYVQLLRRAEYEGKDLTEREIADLAESLEKGGLDEVDVTQHVDVIQRHLAALKAKELLPRIVRDLTNTEAEIVKLEEEQAAWHAKALPVHQRAEALRINKRQTENTIDAAGVQTMEEDIARLVAEKALREGKRHMNGERHIH